MPCSGAWHDRVKCDMDRRSVYGTGAAVRLANRPLAIRDAVLEARVYEILKHLQGQCVPRLIAHGSSANGEAYFVATEFMEVR